MSLTLKFGLLACSAVLVSACSTMHRSSASGYEGRGFGRGDSNGSSSGNALGETSSGDYPEAMGVRSVLAKAEARLEGRRERDQYFKNKPYMKSDRDRLEFLMLDSYDDRNRWLTQHGVFGTETPNSPEIQGLIEINDITVGMTKQAVRDSWGEPELVEVAGNPLYGNERWAYREQLPSSEGFQTEKRVVYFEAGRVIGWDRH